LLREHYSKAPITFTIALDIISPPNSTTLLYYTLLSTPINSSLASTLLLTPFKPKKAPDPKNIDLLLMPPQLPTPITYLLNTPNINISIKSLINSSKHLPLILPLPKQPLQPPPRLPNSQTQYLFKDVFFINSKQYKSYTSAYGILFTPISKALNFYLDTSTGITLIKESKLMHFPNIKLCTGP
jgi:hypothetical protein